MSKTVVGTVREVTERPWSDQETGRSVTLYSFMLEGDRTFYRTGTTPPPVAVGQSVQFVADGQKVDLKSVEQVTGTAGPVAPAPTPGHQTAATTVAVNGASSGLSREGYWDRKDARDIAREARYQEVSEPRMALSVATEAASRVVVAALQTEALSFGNTAKSKREGMLGDFVKTIATDLALFIQNAPSVLEEARTHAVTPETPVVETGSGLDEGE